LPEAAREDHDRHSGFLVGKKKFAWYLDDYHGDGLVVVCCRVAPGENRELVSMFPERYVLPAYVAQHGWVSLRLDVPTVDWDEVRDLILTSYRIQAPKRLAALANYTTG
jgi:phosphoribosylglycinamide formyltransferase-1/phosphoribosylamine--glycine ligase/phosphoribosylglycinamide formyltransferase/phosphoribosylformylglycinamidine cyclo-ligase